MLKKRACARGAAVAVVASALIISFPASAWATLEEDQTPATPEEIAAAKANGEILSLEDVPATMSAPLVENRVAASVDMIEYGGATMFETAASQALAAFPKGSRSAVIAGPGDAWVDALASAGLAASKGPVLFTEKESLHPATADALARLGVESVVVVGGEAAVGEGAVRGLEAAGVKVEARLWGADCYGTQMAIYEYGRDNGLWEPGLAIVATGGHYGDALSASPAAYAKKAPVFLSEASGMRAPQKEALAEAAASGAVSRVAIAGGTAAVPASVERYASGLGLAVERLWGATQYETSAAIAEWEVSDLGFKWDGAAFATGRAPYDALAGSVLQGRAKSVLLLADEGWMAAAKAAAANKGGISSIRFLGGTAAVSSAARAEILTYLSDSVNYEPTGISLAKMASLESKAASVIDPNAYDYNDSEFYQFAVVDKGYSGKVTAAQLDNYITSTANGRNGMLAGQGQVFIDAAKKYGVNEVYLLAHAILESGWGTSALANGTVKGYEGYYNFYGIGAYDLDPNNGGAALAKSKGWDTPRKAIMGAAEWIANGYLNNEWNQNTLYKMRWNYPQAAQTGSYPWKQYATADHWATGIANVMGDCYRYNGIDKSKTGLTFLVPLYS